VVSVAVGALSQLVFDFVSHGNLRRRADDPWCFARAPLDQAIEDLRAKLAK
jgi:hypothetical protein